MKIKNKKSKKADIPITILTLGVLVICALAIVSFVVSQKWGREDVLGIKAVEAVNSDIEKFHFYLNAGFSKEEAAEKINAKIDGDYLIIGKEEFRKTWFGFKQEKFISVEYKEKLD